jgi:DNA-binding PadR family transcriptional regulator
MIGRGHHYKGNRVSPLQTVMLMLLENRPMYGYELLKVLRDRFEGVWTPQTGTVYPALRRLGELGLIASEMREGTEYYALTPEGEEWTKENVKVIPNDVRFIWRYMEVLSEEAQRLGLEPKAKDRGLMAHAKNFAERFAEDSAAPEDRAKMLKAMRAQMIAKLASIQKELEDLESKSKKKGEN